MSLLKETTLLEVEPLSKRPEAPLVEARNISLKYITGNKREDLQSRVYGALYRQRRAREIELWALKNFSCSAYPGSIVGIIGLNGAGKTTLCRVVSGLLRPDEGEISANGRVSALLSLGAGFNKDLTGRENIVLNGMMLGFSRKQIEELMPRIIEFAGVGRFIDQPLKIYSSGMRARLGFSIAAMLEPEIFIIDEALSAGDMEFNEKAARKMQEIVSRARLVMVVTHQVNFVERYCNRALWIEKGYLKADGSPQGVVAQYRASLPQRKEEKKVVSLTSTTSRPGSKAVVLAHGLSVRFFLNRTKSYVPDKNNPLKRLFPWKRESFWALQKVSFAVNEGEIVGIIGPNGSGKTTLCRVLTGILKPDRGKVSINGDTTALLSLGTGFNIQLSGRDNIYLNGMMLGIPRKKISALFDDIVSFSELEKFINRPVKHYSSGMRSRLAFSIAAMIQPNVFIIDEALNAGDASFFEKASARIQELIGKARAAIVVTHNMDFVEKVCTRALLLDKGTIHFDGEPEEAVKYYRETVKRATSRGK